MSARDKAKADTRQKAIEAAQQVWALPGNYDRHGIREVAVAMGMSTGAVFANFESKEALWCAAFPGQPAPVDSPLTRLAGPMLALLTKIEKADRESCVLTALDPQLASEVHMMMGRASMALELKQAA